MIIHYFSNQCNYENKFYTVMINNPPISIKRTIIVGIAQCLCTEIRINCLKVVPVLFTNLRKKSIILFEHIFNPYY